MRPVIGICTAIEVARWAAWELLANVSPRSYSLAVQRAGGMALLLPPDDAVAENPDELLDMIDGLLLAGGSDIDPATYAMDVDAAARAITPRTRAILPVHLYGHPAPMDRIVELARAHRLAIVEDAAQAVGGAWAERPIGAWGDAACLSFYPTKNLGACGDGGMVLTDRPDVAERVAKLRHHGDSGRYQHEELGFCSRLDEMQAAVLRVKLARLPAWTQARRRIAERYRELLVGASLTLPTEAASARHVFHLFTVRHSQRDALAKALTDRGIGTGGYYPRPVPAQPVFGLDYRRWPEAARAAREVLSLPCFAELSDDEVEQTAAAVRKACESL